MQNKIALILLIALPVHAAEPKCVLERVKVKVVCTEEKHPIAGAGVGWLLFGPLGAVAGAIVGSNPDKKCHEVEEKTCDKYEDSHAK